ncbi:MAG: L-seryl-tRNA(Sec) selenium transferase [Deltaproteobacteria bacterium]|nr:L-seryl-tRNA(Sec) selenium transferase [Candidatus Anaeroferrophillacea bacterium]
MTETLDIQRELRQLPAVDELLKTPAVGGLLERFPRPLVVEQLRHGLAEIRQLVAGERRQLMAVYDYDTFIAAVAGRLEEYLAPRLKRVINATGVVIHTNLGRAPLPEAAVRQAAVIACRYSNLEYDLAAGRRGLRYDNVEELLCRLTGAEAAMVVNNNAGAVLLVLSALAAGREVVVSRGELIEIGGAFRIPEVIVQGGALLREVGATNRTHLRDYEQAIGEDTALILKVHTSNYRIAGFTTAVDSRTLAALAARRGVPLVEDLGSGCLLDLAGLGVGGEPSVRRVVESGIDVVTFSGDKLVGGPQAGIIVGRRELIERIRMHPLNRALRIDKLTLAFLEEVLRLYLDPERVYRVVPTLAMLTTEPAVLKRRARRLARELEAVFGDRAEIAVVAGVSRAGGGALPLVELPTRLVTLDVHGMAAAAVERYLRCRKLPVVVRIADDRVVFDPRTLFADDFQEIAAAGRELVASGGRGQGSGFGSQETEGGSQGAGKRQEKRR